MDQSIIVRYTSDQLATVQEQDLDTFGKVSWVRSTKDSPPDSLFFRFMPPKDAPQVFAKQILAAVRALLEGMNRVDSIEADSKTGLIEIKLDVQMVPPKVRIKLFANRLAEDALRKLARAVRSRDLEILVYGEITQPIPHRTFPAKAGPSLKPPFIRRHPFLG